MQSTILILITELDPGGAERLVLDLARSLDRTQFLPLVCALDGRGALAEQIQQQGIDVLDLGATSCFQLGVVWALRRILKERDVKLVHAHLFHAGVIGRLAAQPLKIPVVYTCHIVDRRPVWWHFLLDRLTARWCHVITCVSDAARKFHQQKSGLSPLLYQLIYNGIDLERFSVSRQEARAALGICSADESCVIGAMGRFDRQKGFDIYLKALAIVTQENPQVKFYLAGYGNAEAELRALARALAVPVIFAGYQSDPQNFWPALDIAVIPSRWEGFGLVVVEAMQSGCAVIASNVDSIPEIIQNGVSGALVPPENPQALAHAIQRLIDNPQRCHALAESGKDRAKCFSLQKMVREYEQLYLQVLGDIT